MSGASMMQGSGRPQVSDEGAMSPVGAILGPRSSYPKNLKKPETARISPKISPKSPVMSRALLCGGFKVN